VKTRIDKNEIFKTLIPATLSIFIIFTSFNAPFNVRLFFFLSLIILFFFYGNSNNNLIKQFLSSHHIIIFSLFCLASFFFVNNSYDYIYSPNIINIIALSTLAVFVMNYTDIYEKTMDYTLYILTLLLTLSLFIHFFIFESNFLSATLYFYEFENEDYATKNTLGVLLCLILPHVFFQLNKKISFINVYIFLIFTLSIFYLFSRTALVLYLFILIAMIFTFRKKIILITFGAFIFLIAAITTFQITPEKYNELKSIANQQIKAEYTQPPNSVFSYDSYRSQYIVKSIIGFTEKPIFGHGLSTFQQNHKTFDEDDNLISKHITHNDYAQILYEQGIFGFSLFIYLIITILLRLFKNENDSLLFLTKIIQFLTLLISMNFINLLDHALFWIFVALNSRLKKTHEID